MDDISKITHMLKIEINKHNSDEEQLEQMRTTKELYEEIFHHINTIDELIENKETVLILLENIDKNIALSLANKIVLIEKYKRLNLTNLKEYEDIIKYINKLFSNLLEKFDELKLKYSELEKIINNNSDKILIYKIILSKVKYKQYIPYKMVDYLNEFFITKGFTEIEQIKFLEIISIYNRNIYEKVHQYHYSYKNEVLDMLSFGFEIIDDDGIDYNIDIAKKIQLHYSLLQYQTDFEKYFEEIKQEIDNENDLKLFYILMLRKIQNELIETISLIKNKDFYADLSLKKEIIKDYQNLIDLYLKFRKQYYNIISKENELVNSETVKIIFAKDLNDKAYFIKDLKNINNEYLEKMLDLLISLINGTITNKNIQGFTSRYKDLKKLKNDQIRIVIRQINPNLYCIMGVGVKKDNTGTVLYNTLCRRKYPIAENEIDNLINESDSILEYIKQYVMENKRKGNR